MRTAELYLAICIASIGAALLLPAPDVTSLVYGAALAIAIVGVPHGGLDHWTGRRLLRPYSSQRWWLMFFPGYLTIAITFAAGWWIAPVLTVVLFFVASAWHFGREDGKVRSSELADTTSESHLAAIAVGGLIVWIPALLRGDEMRTLLSSIVPAIGPDVTQQIVAITQVIAILLVPIALGIILSRIVNNSGRFDPWIPLATIALAATTPILLSFTVYFCAWHSVHGLQRLQREEGLSNTQFIQSIAPLSILATVGIAFAGWYFQDIAAALKSGTLTNQQAILQTLFIGLSSIAIPHLILHETADYIAARSTKHRQLEKLSPVVSKLPENWHHECRRSFTQHSVRLQPHAL